MSWYREKYLKSPEWKSTRALAIASRDSKCALCLIQMESLDVHHLSYKNLFQEKQSELRPVCRECHDKVHELLNKFPKLKKLPPRQQWAIIQTHLHKHKAELKTGIVNRNRDNKKHRKYGRRTIEFGICREVLSSLGIISKSKMKWCDSLSFGKMNRNNPILFLEEYIQATNNDPRLPEYKSIPERLLTFNVR